MKHIREIIVAPVISEKSTNLKIQNNCYVFKVSLNANKIEIKHAIEKIFNVKVEKVNTIRQRGKIKRMGRYSGKRPDWKKAIVKLRKGDSIAELEV